jgi:hypothetical protein
VDIQLLLAAQNGAAFGTSIPPPPANGPGRALYDARIRDAN